MYSHSNHLIIGVYNSIYEHHQINIDKDMGEQRKYVFIPSSEMVAQLFRPCVVINRTDVLSELTAQHIITVTKNNIHIFFQPKHLIPTNIHRWSVMTLTTETGEILIFAVL